CDAPAQVFAHASDLRQVSVSRRERAGNEGNGRRRIGNDRRQSCRQQDRKGEKRAPSNQGVRSPSEKADGDEESNFSGAHGRTETKERSRLEANAYRGNSALTRAAAVAMSTSTV